MGFRKPDQTRPRQQHAVAQAKLLVAALQTSHHRTESARVVEKECERHGSDQVMLWSLHLHVYVRLLTRL